MIDVVIVGGGPAGSTAARLLASWGWSVVVLERTGRGGPRLTESLPPSTKKLLAFLGQLDDVEARGFCPNAGNIVWWAGQSRVTETDAPGLHVARAEFDSVLRRTARDRGAIVLDGTVRDVRLGDPAEIDYVTADGQSHTCRARRVLDCSGRAGVVARNGLRRHHAAYRTLAITMDWEEDRDAVPDRTHTLIESYEDGWAWSVPSSAHGRQCTVMIDWPARGERPVASTLQTIYLRELAKARAISSRLSRAGPVSRAWSCNASLYDASRAAAGGTLLVGDTASFVEPLSAAGVKKALASAWRAAVVTNTCLTRPEMAAAATEFFVRREGEVYAECQRLAGRFFSEAAETYRSPFWEARGGNAAGQDGETAPATADDLVRDPGVRAAFEELRGAPRVRLRPAAGLRFEPTPVIEGREVVLRDGVALPGARDPLRFAAGVNLPALVSLTGRHTDMSSVISAYQAEIAPAPVQELLAGLSLLVAHRRLINEDSAS